MRSPSQSESALVLQQFQLLLGNGAGLLDFSEGSSNSALAGSQTHVLHLVGIAPLVFRTNDGSVCPGEVSGGRTSALTCILAGAAAATLS